MFLNDQNGGFRQLSGSQVAQDDVASIFSLGTGKGNEFFTINCGYEGTGGVMLTRHRLVEEKILSDSVINIPIKSVGAVARRILMAMVTLICFLEAGFTRGNTLNHQSPLFICTMGPSLCLIFPMPKPCWGWGS